MKVIFLDVDGVLNFDYSEARTPNGYIGVVDSKVSKLKNIIDKTGAYIILSSDWKQGWSKEDEECGIDAKYLNRKLNRKGLHIIDKTPDFRAENRGTEISEWLKNHTVESYCVIDDIWFCDFSEDILKHLILTDARYGLTDEDVEKAIKILGERQ